MNLAMPQIPLKVEQENAFLPEDWLIVVQLLSSYGDKTM